MTTKILQAGRCIPMVEPGHCPELYTNAEQNWVLTLKELENGRKQNSDRGKKPIFLKEYNCLK